MNESLKVQSHHLERSAYLYVRQSSMRQVMENVESTKRQYGLRTRAIALGWSEEHIVVIDNDQGESGASAAWREGFQRLVSDVGMGKAGIVMGLEVSRLARNNADWHRLLEICALANTLILDEDGVYDPANFNDRLLLGLKGTMSEAELHVLKARLRGGVLNAARRGEYRCPLPTGFEYDSQGEVVLDPDSQVRETIGHFFETFNRVGSASQTVKAFRDEGLRFPSRLRGKVGTIFRDLTNSAAIRTLHNPRYAGVYAYGRRTFRRAPDGKTIVKNRSCKDWLACIQDAHPGYISWEQYQENLKLLEANGRQYALARVSPPREGPALLQGRTVCGRCGAQMRVRYATRRARREAWYVCDRAHTKKAEPSCQSIAAAPIDQAIGKLVVQKMTPAAVELALEIRAEIESRQQETDHLRCRAVERAQIDADLAQRRFLLVDPGNRLVADTLESQWNEKLRLLEQSREDLERDKQADQVVVDETVRRRLITMTTNFQKLWIDADTPNRERKRMLELLIEDATLVKVPTQGITQIHVRFKGGLTQTMITLNPRQSGVKTDATVIGFVDSLLNDHTNAEIAERLNDHNLRPGGSLRAGRSACRFTANRVSYIVQHYNLRTRYDRLRERGMLTKQEAATRLNIHVHTLATWAKHGLVVRHSFNAHAYLYELPDNDLPAKKCSRWHPVADRPAANNNSKNLKA